VRKMVMLSRLNFPPTQNKILVRRKQFPVRAKTIPDYRVTGMYRQVLD
jgi:hypothetical protein